MGSFSLWHWLVVIILVLLLFGRGRISDMMGDIGKGLKSFKQGMADEEAPPRHDPKSIENRPLDVTAEPRPREGSTAVPPRDDSSTRP
jgi:sec-independent protein translocase protein TatA